MFEKKYTPEEIIAIEKYLRNSNLAFAARTSLLIKNLNEHIQYLNQQVENSSKTEFLKDELLKENSDLIHHQQEVIRELLLNPTLGFTKLLESILDKLEHGIQSEKDNPNHVSIIQTCQTLIKAFIPQDPDKGTQLNDTESKSSE